MTRPSGERADTADAAASARWHADAYAAALEQTSDGVILADASGRIIFVNEAARHIHGIAELGVPAESWGTVYGLFTLGGEPYAPAELPLARAVAQGETVVGAEWKVLRPDGTLVVAQGSAAPIVDQAGRRIGAVLTLRDVTGEHDARRRLEASERQARFWTELGLALQPLAEPGEIMSTAARMLGEHLGADRCAYAEVEPDEDHFVITGDYVRGDAISIVGRFALSAFGAEALRLMQQNHAYVVDDVLNDPRVSDEDRAAYLRTQIGAVVCVPLHKADRFVAGVAVHQRTPRHWAPDEVEMVSIVTQRCWESIERARTLRTLYEQNAQLQEQGLELELANQQLQEQTAELEAQTEELQATAAQLEERTEDAERALREAGAERARAESILDGMADAHFVLDAEFRFVAANRAMERGTGLMRQALLGRSIWEVFPGTVGTDFERHYRRVAVEKAEAHFTHEYGDGRLDLVANVDAYPAADGGLVVFWRDVTERERVVARLRESESQLRTLADAIPTLAWTARADGFIDWYNARWYEYTGTTPEEMEGWGWQSVHDPATLAAVLERWRESIASGTAFEMTFPLRGADGRFRAFLTRVMPVTDADGQVVRWFGTNTDVEAERAARDAAVESAARTERLQALTAALAATVTVDEVAAVVVAQGVAAAGATTGALFTRVPGTDEVLVVRQTGLDDAFLAQYGRFTLDMPGPGAACLRTGEPVFIEARGGPDGLIARFPAITDIWERLGTHAVATVPLSVAGKVIGAVSFTFAAPHPLPPADRAFFLAVGRQAGQAIERARLLAAEREARAEAEVANRAKAEFLSTMSHELRTPLNAIGGYAELLEMGLRGPVTEAQLSDLERIRRAGQYLQSLINDILNFARLDAGQVRFDLRDVPLEQVMDDVVELVLPQLRERGLEQTRECTLDAVGRPPVARADPEKIRQILLNLLTNAIKFTPPGGLVHVACAAGPEGEDGGCLYIRVSDTGRGIAGTNLSRIFEPFVQLDRQLTGDSQQGVGLGLAISRDLARGMGGDLTVESTPGAGSTFTLTLPRAQTDDDARAGAGPTAG